MSGILRSRLEMARMAREWRLWASRMAEAADKLLGSCETYVFGSIAEDKATGGSDVDLLIICRDLPEEPRRRWSIVARIEEEAGLPPLHPFEIHLVDEEEASHLKHLLKGRKIKIK